MLDPFGAYLLVRQQLRQKESRNLALIAEALMEQLAVVCEAPVEEWRVLGLLSQLDREYAASNLDVRGTAARQHAELEGLSPELGLCLSRFCDPSSGGPSCLAEAGLIVAEQLAGVLARELAASSADAGDGRASLAAQAPELQAALAQALAAELSRAARSPDTRIDRALEVLAVALPRTQAVQAPAAEAPSIEEQIAACGIAAALSVEQDLRR